MIESFQTFSNVLITTQVTVNSVNDVDTSISLTFAAKVFVDITNVKIDIQKHDKTEKSVVSMFSRIVLTNIALKLK